MSTKSTPHNVVYINKTATRRKKCTDHLIDSLSTALIFVYGQSHIAKIYSGGQDRKGKGGRRTGSVRHDDYGQGGRAMDVYIYDGEGKKLTGAELAPLVQYWLAAKIGGVGIEMRVGGVHLDEWAKPPRGGGMVWYYDYDAGSADRKAQKKAVRLGQSGVFPDECSHPRDAISGDLTPAKPSLVATILSLFNAWGKK